LPNYAPKNEDLLLGASRNVCGIMTLADRDINKVDINM